MTWGPDDFYDEPSEFDQQIDEFRKTILKAVKTNFITKMDELEKENTELQEVKKNFDQIKRDYASKERQLERDRSQMERAVRKERITDLLKDHEVIMYRASRETEKLPKCDKCDEQRKFYFKTPLGNDTHEMCTCSVGKQIFIPREYIRTEFSLRGSYPLVVWYKPYEDGDGYSSGDVPECIYQEGMKYEDIKSYYRAYFKSKEECQKYCDWLIEKELNEGAVNQ